MSQYVKVTGALGNTLHPWQWRADGKCIDTRSGKVVDSDACMGEPPAQSGGGAVKDFLIKTFLPQQGPGYAGPGGAPTTTASNLLLPAVAVVGVIGVLLILKKKK